LSAKLATDATLVEGVFGQAFSTILNNTAAAILGLGVAFYYSWRLTLVVSIIIVTQQLTYLIYWPALLYLF
jgi:ATP-binding cassette subfamily B (MDR/TAP) protein 1